MIEHKAPISGIAAFGNQYVATAGYDNQVILWDARDKCGLARVYHDHLANQCDFSPDGKLLASSSSDYSARLWELPDFRLKAVLMDHRDDVEGIAFHPNKQLIATGSRDALVRVFDLSGKLIRRMSGHVADVISVAWLGDTTELISSSDDGTIKKWDTDTGMLIGDINLNGIETDTIAISREGIIFAGNDEGQIIVIIGDNQYVYDAHDAGVKRVIYDKAANGLVSLSYDRSAKFWQVCSGGVLELLHSASLPSIVWPRACAYLNSDEVIFVTFGSSYAKYNYKTGIWELDGINHTHGINGACIHQGHVYSIGDSGCVKCDGQLIAELGSLCNFIIPFGDSMLAAGQTGQIFDVLSGECYHQHSSPLNCAVTFGEKSERVIIGSYTGEAVLLELQDGRPVFKKNITLHNNAIKSIAVSSKQLFSVCATGAAAFYSVDNFELLKYCDDAHGKIANGCAEVCDAVFASVSRDLKLRIWENGKATVFETPHQNSIKCCAVSVDKQYIATGDYAGNVGVFSIALGRYVDWSRPTVAGISSLIADHDNNNFLATSYDGNIYSIFTSSHDLQMTGI